MTEFETQNIVDVVIDDRSLTEARADLEESLSSVPVDVQASVTSESGGAAAGSSSEWREQHSLSRERNRLLEEIVEGIDEGNFDRAARSGGGLLGGGAAILGGGALLGVGALAGVLSNFSWPSLPEFAWPELPDIGPPPKPGWTPIDVVEPDPVEVVQPDPVPIESPQPSEYPLEEPGEYPVSEPDPSEYPVEEPDPVETPQPDWLPIEIGAPELSTEGIGSDIGEGAGVGALLAAGVGGALGIEGLRQLSIRSAGGAAVGTPFPTPEMVGATDQEQFNSRRRRFNNRTPEWLELPEIEGENKFSGSVFTSEGRQARVEGIRDLISAINDLREDVQNTQEDTASSRRTDINVETDIAVDGATRREVEQAANQAKEQALREFNQRIQNGR